MAGLTKVYHGDYRDYTKSPAFCNRATGELYINTPVFESFNKNQQFYFIAHEMGHLDLQTENEEAADKYASDLYLKKGLPLSDSVKALTRALKFDKQSDFDRLTNQFNRSANYDLQVNNNQKITNMKIPQYNNANGEVWGDILGNIGGGLGNLGNGIGSVLGAVNNQNIGGSYIPKGSIYTPEIPNNNNMQNPVQPAPVAEKKKNNTILYVGIGVATVVVIIVLIIVFKKKK
ncbi:MAG: hypothetical protein ACOYO1_02490 [Bacteroidales bacterium]